jgi:hypothetical protein
MLRIRSLGQVCALAVTGGMFALAGSDANAQSSKPLSTETASHQHYIKTVFVIMMENHNWTGSGSNFDIKHHTLAPYINYTLIPEASHANNYCNPPHTHPSLPNYLWLEAGTSFGIHNDGSALIHSQGTHEHLTRLLDAAGISWKAYDEATNGKTCPFTHWHNPFVFFRDETGNNNPKDTRCVAHVRPFPELRRDLANGNVARYNFIVPGYCDSMHTSCNGVDPIKEGDDWLRRTVPEILRSTEYRSGAALFIIWDEARRGDGPIPMIVLSPFAKGNGYSNNIQYTHGSTLRTLQEIFGVGPLMRDAAKRPDLRDMFTVFP